MKRPSIADSQCGAFSRHQATEVGISRRTVRRRLANGDWLDIAPRVFVERHTLVTPRTRAWAGHLATGGVVAYNSAAAVHGVGDADSRIHVISRRDLHVDERNVIEHRVRLAPTDVIELDGLPITTRLRTVVDLLATSTADAWGLLFRAVQQRWLDEATLHTQIEERRGMHGNTRLRELVKLLSTGAHSPAELALHHILSTIPGVTFEANTHVVTRGGTWVVDALIRSARIVIEVDGRRYHSSPDQFVNDRRRQNELVAAGFVVLRFTWPDLVERPGDVRRIIERAVAVPSGTKRARTEP